MKLPTTTALLLTGVFSGCAGNSWDQYMNGTQDQKVKYEEAALQNASTIFVKHIDLKDTRFLEVLDVINQYQNEYGPRAVTLHLLTKPIRDFSIAPDIEIARIENKLVSIRAENISLADLIVKIAEDEDMGGTYTNRQFYFFPRKYRFYTNLYQAYDYVEEAPEGFSLGTIIKKLTEILKVYDGRYTISLSTGDEAENRRLLGQVIKLPSGLVKYYDIILLVKNEFNLNFVLISDTHFEFVPRKKNEPTRQP